MTSEYEKVRRKYRRRFKQDAPHVAPREEEDMMRSMINAMKSKNPIPSKPKGYVT